MRTVTIFTLLAVGPVLGQTLNAPSGLVCPSATRAEVRLSWTGNDGAATGYSIERKTLGGTFAAVGTSPAASYSDKSIDAFETYVYRVRATQAPDKTSGPSNEITVGPPPVGLSVAAGLAAGVDRFQLDTETNFGQRISMALDANGDPAMAYRVAGPGADYDKTLVEFVTWNRAQYRWNAPVKVLTTGNTGGTRPFSLARDASSNAWAVAYHTETSNGVRVAVSRDDGATWKDMRAFDCGEQGCVNASVALAKGKVYLAFYHDYNGIRLVSGDLNADPAQWTSSVLPLPAGSNAARSDLDLALDANGDPGVAYWANTDDYNVVLGLWRAKGGTVKVTDTNAYQSDFTAVDLEFNATAARMVFEARRTEDYYSVYDKGQWFVREEGGMFTAPANLPSDGSESLSQASLALGAGTKATVASVEVGGTGEGVRCGQMKLLQTGDLANWTACSPIGRADETFYTVNYPRAAYAGNNKLYVGFTSASSAGALAGVLLWREP